MGNSGPTKLIYDVLIIGGGASGLYAAYAAATVLGERGRVAVVTEGELGSGGCSKRIHGINAAMNPPDSCEQHVADTVASGCRINDVRLVEVLCAQVIDRVRELEGWGVRLTKNVDGGYETGTYGGSTFSRSVFWHDITGLEIVHELTKRVILAGCHVLENRWAADLVIEDGACKGAAVLNLLTNEVEYIYAGSVVLATGGGACVYSVNSISHDKNATGIALGARAGLQLLDMEMVQFHPTGLAKQGSPGHGCLLEEEIRMQGGTITNALGERFLFEYDARGEKATRDVIARAIYTEITEGRGTSGGGVILDISAFQRDYLISRFPHTVKRLREWGVDLLSSATIDITPTAHFLMGGVEIDAGCRTMLDGLFVCGEDAGGVHGANRVGGNGIAEALVFGYIAGTVAAEQAGSAVKSGKLPKPELVTCIPSEAGELDGALRATMWLNCGILRSKERLEACKEELGELSHRLACEGVQVRYDEGRGDLNMVKKALVTDNKILLARCIVEAALSRRGSLGAHHRDDTEQEDLNYNTVVTLEDGGDVKVWLRRSV